MKRDLDRPGGSATLGGDAASSAVSWPRRPIARQPGQPPHDSALGHVQGSARYIDDLPLREGELRIALVGAPCARGRVTRLDLDAVRAAPGVVGVYTAADLPGANLWGPIFHDEPVLAEEVVAYLGQPLAVVAADDERDARAAAALARVEVEEEEPVLTIEQAVAAGEFIGPQRQIARGDLEAGWERARQRIEGRFESKGQEQFYLESQAALVVPEEGGSLLVYSSTQNPTEIQKVVADALGWRQSQVVCEVLRMGAAFGGKDTQAALPSVFAALVAFHTHRPVRVVYGKDEDMLLTGKRHEFHTDYRIGFDERGRIVAAELDVRSNGGAYADLSTAVLERCMLHLDNAYHLPAVRIGARVCRTNLPPNTAFRGFGGPQGMAVIESCMEEIAARLRLDPLDVRRVNLYPADEASDAALTPYGQRVRGNLLPEIFDRLEQSSDYRLRRREISQHNARTDAWGEPPCVLRGLSLVPVEFGSSVANKTLHQANALFNVYTDGSVQVSTGATEMGQGVNTKLAMIVAQEFGIDHRRVVVRPTSTEKNNNTSPTAASASTDLNGAAAVKACAAIRERLAELASGLLAGSTDGLAPAPEQVGFEGGAVFDRRAPERRIDFAELCRRAHVERIDLGARSFYATPGIDFDRETGRGCPFAYYTTGACVAEVRVDRLLGTLELERLDVLMDIGKPIHLAIEMGQIVGGLVQGIGWVTGEELVYDGRGELLTTSPTTYKIPAASDLPRDLRVEILDNDLNRHNVRSTKAVGEPPLMLAIAVWTAVRDALGAAVALGARPGDLRIPATHEEIARTLSGCSVEEWIAAS